MESWPTDKVECEIFTNFQFCNDYFLNKDCTVYGYALYSLFRMAFSPQLNLMTWEFCCATSGRCLIVGHFCIIMKLAALQRS